MGKILLLTDILENLRELGLRPEGRHFLFGMRDLVRDAKSSTGYDPIFHLQQADDAKRFQADYHVIPVLPSQEKESKIIADILAFPGNFRDFCVNSYSPRFYYLDSRAGGAFKMGEQRVGEISREKLYRKVPEVQAVFEENRAKIQAALEI